MAGFKTKKAKDYVEEYGETLAHPEENKEEYTKFLLDFHSSVNSRMFFFQRPSDKTARRVMTEAETKWNAIISLTKAKYGVCGLPEDGYVSEINKALADGN